MPPSRPPRYSPLLLFVDSAAASRGATAHAAALALATGATVAILAVMNTGGELAFTPEAAALYTRLRLVAQTAIEEASATVRGAGVLLVEHLIMDGVPHIGILEVAGELDAGMIVLHAASPAAPAVLQAASCPVLLTPS